jgi:hypothetical protein
MTVEHQSDGKPPEIDGVNRAYLLDRMGGGMGLAIGEIVPALDGLKCRDRQFAPLCCAEDLTT